MVPVQLVPRAASRGCWALMYCSSIGLWQPNLLTTFLCVAATLLCRRDSKQRGLPHYVDFNITTLQFCSSYSRKPSRRKKKRVKQTGSRRKAE